MSKVQNEYPVGNAGYVISLAREVLDGKITFDDARRHITVNVCMQGELRNLHAIKV